jgi:alkylhydroperoxidase/carboxymuconolactone decarboxylase family protein YurZ
MGDDEQLDLYLRRAIESGLTRAQITEALTWHRCSCSAVRSLSAMTGLRFAS